MKIFKTYRKTLLALSLSLLCIPTCSAYGSITLKFNLKCNDKDNVEFSLNYTSNTAGTKKTTTTSVTWNENKDDDGYYSGTMEVTAFKAASSSGAGHTLKVTPKTSSSEYFITSITGDASYSGTPTQSIQTIFDAATTGNTTKSYTVDVYPAVSNPLHREISINFDGTKRDLATVKWNGTTETGTTDTKSKSVSYRTANGIYIDGEQSADFDNSIKITPANGNVGVNWELRNSAGTAVKSGNVVGTDEVEILNWNTASADYNNYTLWYECVETSSRELTSTLTLNFANEDASHATPIWTANGNNIDLSSAQATYTHHMIEYTINGEVQPLTDEFYDNTLSLNVNSKYSAFWTLSKDNVIKYYGHVDGNGNNQDIFSWNTQTLDLTGYTLNIKTIETSANAKAYVFVKSNSKDFTLNVIYSTNAFSNDDITLDWSPYTDEDGHFLAMWATSKTTSGTLYSLRITTNNDMYLYSCSGGESIKNLPKQLSKEEVIKGHGVKGVETLNLQLYPAVTTNNTTSQALNFNGNTDDVLVEWNHNGENETISGTTANYATAWSQTHVHDYLLSESGTKHFNNALTITPQNGKLVSWAINDKNGALHAEGTDVGVATQIAAWHTETVDLDGATLTLSARDVINPSFDITPTQFNHDGGPVTMEYTLDNLNDMTDVTCVHIWVVDLNTLTSSGAHSRRASSTDGHKIVGETNHTDFTNLHGVVSLDNLANAEDNHTHKLAVCAEAVLKNGQTATSDSFVEGMGQGNTGGYEYNIDTNDGTTTGITGINCDGEAAATYYNLQGQRVENPANGIFIRVADGKASKVVI